MGKDITPILAGWDYDHDELQVRIVAGDDGREKIQMRVDLGLLQMEIDGRPDGQRPAGFESLLDHVAVMPGAVDACTVDGEIVVPQEGGFYGGWITSRVVGPFKGVPGSLGW